jgi:hypothetical protein
LTKEKLKENKSLVNFMDDNLAIHMEDYLTNPTIELFGFKKDDLIQVTAI